MRNEIIKVRVFDDKRLAIDILSGPRYAEAYNRIRQLPESKWQYGTWLAPYTELNVEKLTSLFTPAEMDLDEDARATLRYFELTLRQARKKAKHRWEYIFDDAVPAVPFAFTTTPYKHQIVGLDAVHESEFFGLLMEMGTGKTKVMIDELVWQTQMTDKSVRVLVVCPKTIINTWKKEIAKHAPPTMPVFVERVVSEVKGIETLIAGVRDPARLKIWVINYEIVGTMLEALQKMNFDDVILDESTRIKTGSAKRTKAVIALRDSCRRRFILSGNPVVNTIRDLYWQFEFLAPGLLGFSTEDAFTAATDNIIDVKGRDWTTISGYTMDRLKASIANHSFIVKKKQCLDLPDKVFETIEVEMSSEQNELYEQMLNWFLASLEDTKTTATCAIVQMLRLHQICCGFLRNTSGEEIDIPNATTKTDALRELMDDLDGHKAIIWCRFRHDISTVCKLLDQMRIKYAVMNGDTKQADRDTIEDRFNHDDTLSVIVGEPGTGGLGLTLVGNEEHPCTQVVYFSNDFSLEKRVQSEDRCHRIGMHDKVTYTDIVVGNSIEEKIVERLQSKRSLSEDLRDMESIKRFLLR